MLGVSKVSTQLTTRNVDFYITTFNATQDTHLDQKVAEKYGELATGSFQVWNVRFCSGDFVLRLSQSKS